MKKLLIFLLLIPFALFGQSVYTYTGKAVNYQNKIATRLAEFLSFSIATIGDGSGVTTLTMTSSENTELTLDGTARFYTDAGGTLGESTTWTVIPGAPRTIYIRNPSGTNNFLIEKNTIISWGAWDSPANSGRIIGDIGQLTALTELNVIGFSLLSGSIAESTSLTFLRLGGSATITGNIEGLVSLTSTEVYASTTISGDLSIISDGITQLIFNSGGFVTYTAGGNWLSIADQGFVTVKPSGGFGLSSAEVDLFIQEVESTRFSNRHLHIDLTGSNAARTAASDAAVAAIEADGGTVTTN